MADASIAPNTISVLSVVFSVVAGVCLILQAKGGLAIRIILLVMAAAFIQLRLLCNMLDGMVAIEGGRKTPTGEIFNDFPDRISDILILVCVGYGSAATWSPELGWIAALLAVLTAYVRLLGGSLGLEQDFRGPMAKPHRMALLTAGCLLQAVAAALDPKNMVLFVALLLVAVGSLLTIWRRTSRIAKALSSR